jgi:hypothetical protein
VIAELAKSGQHRSLSNGEATHIPADGGNRLQSSAEHELRIDAAR